MKLLRIQEAADRLSVSKKTVERAIAAGEIATVRMGVGGAAVRIHPDDLDAYVASRRSVVASSSLSVYRPARVRPSSTGSRFRDQLRAVS